MLGERQVVDGSGKLHCTRAVSYPNALVGEILDPAGESDHERACGKWIRSGSRPEKGAEYLSFYDAEKTQREVSEAIKNDIDIQLGTSDVSRFMAACNEMVSNAAVAPSVSLAYKYMKKELGSTGSTTPSQTTELFSIMQKMGRLVAHYCDTPVSAGLTFHPTTADAFAVSVKDGVLMSADQATETLLSFGEVADVQDKAGEFIAEMNTAPPSLLTPPTARELSELLRGGFLDTWMEDAFEINSPVSITLPDDLRLLSKFIYALKETTAEHAHAYLLASASQCALSVRSVVTGEFGQNIETAQVASDTRRRRARARSLGRLAFDDDVSSVVDRFSPVNASVLFQASTISWSSLTHPMATVYDTSPSHASAVCWDAAMVAFADALDHRVYKKLVSQRVVSNILLPLIQNLKAAVAAEVQSGRTSKLISNAGDRATLAIEARSVRFRIAGAERTSKFGRAVEFERPSFDSADGALVMMLKQAKAVFLDRMRLGVDGSDLCQHPPLYPSSDRNAYLLTAAPCVMLLPGLLVVPFVSDRFDAQSLYGRIGFVVAHEIAHVASKQALWNTDVASSLLENYSASTWVEAAADLTAADAIVATGMLTSEEACAHISQLWCARVPTGYFEIEGRSHPPANQRGDGICNFLRSSI